MTLDDVRELDATLQTRGETLSANKIVQHRGGSKRDALRLMRQYRAEAPPSPTPGPPDAPAAPVAVLEPAVVPKDAAPVSAAPEAGPLPLLAQADADYQAALRAERRAQRDVDSAPRAERERLTQGWHTATRQREQAAALVAQRQRARDHLRAAIPGARIAARRAAGELSAIEDQVRRQLIQSRRAAQQTKDELYQMIHDLVAIAGKAAVPREE